MVLLVIKFGIIFNSDYNKYSAGLLITGGMKDEETVLTTEIFDPDAKTIRIMSSLPSPGRAYHSLDSNLTCGGLGSNRTCDVWNGREWERANVTLKHSRFWHVSWPRHDGVLLMGGEGYGGGEAMSTELVTWDGKTSTVNFSLEYPLQ